MILCAMDVALKENPCIAQKCAPSLIVNIKRVSDTVQTVKNFPVIQLTNSHPKCRIGPGLLMPKGE